MSLKRSLSREDANKDIEIPLLESPEPSQTITEDARQRRSSFLSRGKRASSLKAGALGLPHPTINDKNFYLHIQSDLPMPSRMKTLLAWSIRRNIDRQDSVHKESLALAKKIEEKLFRSLADGDINTSWYTRPKDPNENKKTIKIPNPLNLDNKLKYSDLQLSINRYNKEDKSWRAASDNFRKSKRLKSFSSNIDIADAESFLDESWRSKLKDMESSLSFPDNLPELKDLQNIDFRLNDYLFRLNNALRESQTLKKQYTITSTVFSRSTRDSWLFDLDPVFLLRGILDLLPSTAVEKNRP